MKNVSLLSLVFFIYSLSFAQDYQTHHSTSSGVQFGLKAGVNLANYKDKAVPNTSSRTGFYAGGLVHIPIVSMFAIQPEAVYSSQGAKFNDGTGVAKLGYVNIPVMLQYTFLGNVRLETGPQIGFLTSAKSELNEVETNNKPGFKSTDFSWGFGIGFLVHSGFGLSGRYNLGISNIDKLANSEINNRVWQIGAFYQFH
jgi:hypothetical protein